MGTPSTKKKKVTIMEIKRVLMDTLTLMASIGSLTTLLTKMDSEQRLEPTNQGYPKSSPLGSISKSTSHQRIYQKLTTNPSPNPTTNQTTHPITDQNINPSTNPTTNPNISQSTSLTTAPLQSITNQHPNQSTNPNLATSQVTVPSINHQATGLPTKTPNLTNTQRNTNQR